MLRNKFYYAVKPVVPAPMRLAIRRWFTIRKRNRVGHLWPVLPGSEKPPRGWTGWPQGKQFAVVLTHDVEGPLGVEKCRQLMHLEMELGFRSSFGLIPEGPYAVPESLRDELVRNGFEVAVHDLNHDGKLYLSRHGFARKAVRINHYLKTWGAVGFRSGFMLRRLDWLHDLAIEYDASTFDTDPFEPEPEGASTIFPFWVPAPAQNPKPETRNLKLEINPSSLTPHSSPFATRPGYVELPYTLPQDSTLFLLLQERQPDVWIRKLDWVASHGGMVLLDTHPDYMSFNGCPRGYNEFEVAKYEDLLKHLSRRYEGLFWHALPKDVAAFARSVLPSAPAL